MPVVFADSPAAGASPNSISPDQTNTLTVTDNAHFIVTSVKVTGPDGTNYTSTICTLSLKCTGDSSNPVTLTFGNGVPLTDWKVTAVGSGCPGYIPTLNGPANTYCGGDYTYSIAGVALS
ncbi:MAG: hypothetical protein ACRDF4_03545, partial [Rhabdochlamydiaceae bacterium]